VGFTIVAFSGSAVMNLDLNSPHYSTINGGEQQFYSFLCDPNEEFIFISRHVLSSGVGAAGPAQDSGLQFYVGSNYFKDAEDYELDFSGHHSSTFVLDYNGLTKVC
jgi:hypothetical protein